MSRANWLYFLGTKKNKQELFVYGLSLPTKSTHLYNIEHKLGKVGDKHLYLFESVAEDIDDTLINNESLNLRLFHNKVLQSINIDYKNRYIQNYDTNHETPISFNGQTLYIDVLYTSHFYDYENSKFLKLENKKELNGLLDLLEKDNSLNFKEAYFERLGCFEYAHAMPWAETVAPFIIKSATTVPNTYKIIRKTKYQDKRQSVHLVVKTTSGNVLLDEMKTFKKGQLNLHFKTPVLNDAYFEYSVFDKSGKLIHKENGYWMLGFSMQVSMHNNTVNLKTVKKGKEKSITISSYSPTIPIEIGYPDDKIIKNYKTNRNILKSICKPNTEYSVQKWFDKNENSVEEIMKYINSLLHETSTIITIIDPFFSAEALWALAQINNSSIKIKIISCWSNNDPDTGENSTYNANVQKVIDIVKKLEGTRLPVEYLTWHNFGEANFHDRYIVIKTSQNERVFSVPNSMNNLLKKYNFSIIELIGNTKENALKYLHEKIELCNEKNRILPEVEENV